MSNTVSKIRKNSTEIVDMLLKEHGVLKDQIYSTGTIKRTQNDVGASSVICGFENLCALMA